MRPSSGTVDQALSQWLDEVRSVGRVKHANIVPAYEVDIQDVQPYLVFEYIAGQTLEQLLKKDPKQNKFLAEWLLSELQETSDEVKAALEVFESNDDPEIRATVAAAAAKPEDLCARLKDPWPIVRAAAARGRNGPRSPPGTTRPKSACAMPARAS